MPRRVSSQRSVRRREPWWLSGGGEECPYCGQLYAYEVEIHCADCDGPACPHCILRYEDRHVCPDCSGDIGQAAAKV